MRYAEMVSHRKRRLAEHCQHAGTSRAIVESVDKLCDIPQAGYRNTGLSTIHPHSMSSCQSFGTFRHLSPFVQLHRQNCFFNKVMMGFEWKVGFIGRIIQLCWGLADARRTRGHGGMSQVLWSHTCSYWLYINLKTVLKIFLTVILPFDLEKKLRWQR